MASSTTESTPPAAVVASNSEEQVASSTAASQLSSTPNISTLLPFKLFNPPAASSSTPLPSLPDSYFTPTTSELKAAYAAQVRVRENLINAPLKTQAMRESEEKAKQTKWLNTTIRVKFPDRTQLEKTFPSTDKIKSVYAFVRSALREDMKPNKFILYQAPPRREYKVSDPAVRDLNLSQLQLSPSSILLLSFVDEELNDPSLRAPLLEEVLARAQDLPPPPNYDQTPEPEDKKRKQTATTSSDASGEKKVPKWLKLGKK